MRRDEAEAAAEAEAASSSSFLESAMQGKGAGATASTAAAWLLNDKAQRQGAENYGCYKFGAAGGGLTRGGGSAPADNDGEGGRRPTDRAFHLH